MSWRAVAWALEQATGAPGMKLTLMALASYASSDDYTAWPTQQILAHQTEQSVDSIQRHIRLLAEQGLISVERRRRRVSKFGVCLVYRLNVDKPHNAACGTPHSAARHEARHAANDLPTHRKYPSDTPQALRPQPSLIRTVTSEPLEPQAAKAEEGEPSLSPVTTYVRQREEEERRLTECRKQRSTIDQLKQRHGPTWGLKQYDPCQQGHHRAAPWAHFTGAADPRITQEDL